MIDAYEIGIKLALQDGVSGGLATIARELAEVDRAIAATNAGLVALVGITETAARAAAVVRGIAPERSGSLPTHVEEAPLEISLHGTKAATPPNQILPQNNGSPRETIAAAPPVSLSSVVAPGPVGRNVVPTQPPSVEWTPPLAQPVTSALQASGVDRLIEAPHTIGEAPVVAREGAPMTPITMAIRARTSQDIAKGPPAQAKSFTAAAPTQAIERTNVVISSIKDAVAPGHVEPSKHSRGLVPQHGLSGTQAGGGASSAAAPGSEIDRGAGVPSVARAPERASAPQPQAREAGDGASGTVMLDGRLVGYWLSEQMAREASKPPASTTFFDPA